MGCAGSQGHSACLQAVEEAVKENALTRLSTLLAETSISTSEMDRKNLLHQAAWLGYPTCVRMLLESGASPDDPHRKNGCTPLHLAHFCTVDDANPKPTIDSLLAAGADVNNPGSAKCGRLPLDHAIQHQRLNSVTALLAAGSQVTIESILSAIDVASPQILQLLLTSGGDCGKQLETTVFWGRPLTRVMYAPLKGPKECYRQMFTMLVQATVCKPIQETPVSEDDSPDRSNAHTSQNYYPMIEFEMKTLARECSPLTDYLYLHLIRNGFRPSDTIRSFMGSISDTEWLDEYLRSPPSLRDLSMRVTRSYLYLSGNIIYGVEKMKVPPRIRDIVLMYNPLNWLSVERNILLRNRGLFH